MIDREALRRPDTGSGEIVEEVEILAGARNAHAHGAAVYTKNDFASGDNAAIDAYREKTSIPPIPRSNTTLNVDAVDDAFLDNVLHHVDHNLYVLPAGNVSGNPVILLDNFLMDSVLKTAKNRFEAVFIDSPNLNMFKDAAILSSRVDGVALVVDEGRDKRHVVKASIDLLEHKKAKMLGFILNKRTLAIPDFIYKRL
jgi:Mrp family chromosome partitioning ATPase